MPLVTCRVTDGELTTSQVTYLERIRVAAVQHDRLLDAGALSVPSRTGQLVISVSSNLDRRRMDEQMLTTVYRSFIEEADRIAEQRSRAGLYAGIVIRQHADVAQIERDLANPEISDMVFIGEGAISRYKTDRGGRDMNWAQVASAATTLKQGAIEQRMCGHFPRVRFVDVPFGTFAVSQYSNVLAATGQLVPDINPPDTLFQPIFPNPTPDIVSQIIDLDARYPRRLD